MKKKKIVQGISFGDKKFLEEAKLRADRLGMSFSAYVKYLVEQDLQERGDVILREKPEKQKGIDDAE